MSDIDTPRWRVKPLGHKAYGSIPHLPGSRLGPADRHCHEGQAAICWVRPRDRHDRIIVTEKLDGSCTAVARIGNDIVALGRAGHLAETSPYEQHHLFAAWVHERRHGFRYALRAGERLVGEWLAQAHGTRYRLDGEPPWVAFDLMDGMHRLPHDEMQKAARIAMVRTATVLHDSNRSAPICDISPRLEKSGHGAIDPVEGAVWRVERRCQFDFMAKWVRSEKIDGCYLPKVSGQPEVWNWRPDAPATCAPAPAGT